MTNAPTEREGEGAAAAHRFRGRNVRLATPDPAIRIHRLGCRAVGLPVALVVAWCHSDRGQQWLFELQGTLADPKKHVLFEAGHGNLPRFQVEKEALRGTSP